MEKEKKETSVRALLWWLVGRLRKRGEELRTMVSIKGVNKEQERSNRCNRREAENRT
jgi:hypothetical protein